MIPLHPVPHAHHECPFCGSPLTVSGWLMPGMRNLADLKCEPCSREFFGDLPAGHGLYYPALLEKSSGQIHGEDTYFSRWLSESFAARSSTPLPVSWEVFRSFKRPVILNCMDGLYGHSLLKLLNAQFYLDHCKDFDLVLLVPRSLFWLIPEGTAAVLTVDVPFKQATQWNDWLAEEIRTRLSGFPEIWLSVAITHPHPSDFTIERFTRVKPFVMETWSESVASQPTITFIWREDRLWGGRDQRNRVVEFADSIRKNYPNVDFAVCGLSSPGGLPEWIADLRTNEVTDSLERSWCDRYARSQIVAGIHGSNMLLPSAHAAAVIDLVPADRWPNAVQDLMPCEDARESLIRYRLLSAESTSDEVAEIALTMLKFLPFALLNFNKERTNHSTIQADPEKNARLRRSVVKLLFHDGAPPGRRL